jgi:large subunit ribosomal protein L16
MLSPKKTKYRKAFKGRIKGVATSNTQLNFGTFGMKAIEPSRVTARQIEAARRAITRHLKRQGRVWIRVFPAIPATKKPAEVRMGSGKGSPEFWYCRVHPGHILFEVDGVPVALAREAFDLAAAKLPIKTRFIARVGEEAA